jgi:hypothetical protein
MVSLQIEVGIHGGIHGFFFFFFELPTVGLNLNTPSLQVPKLQFLDWQKQVRTFTLVAK